MPFLYYSLIIFATEAVMVPCSCGDVHKDYRNVWLEPVQKASMLQVKKWERHTKPEWVTVERVDRVMYSPWLGELK